MRSTIASIENVISQDPGHRNVFPLVRRDHLRLAALSLLGAKRVLIVSGFPILKAGAGETDGPPGAVAVGNALGELGIESAYVTDELTAPLYRAMGAGPLVPWRSDLLEREAASHLVAVERPGRARDDRYYNMRGEDISHLVAPMDGLFLAAEARGIVTIGIGDGGNEVGMGRVFRGVFKAVPHGPRIASTVLTDYVVVSGVSNWGAYGLVAALSVLSGRDLLPSAREMTQGVEALVAAGAVDGLSGRPEPRVDGLPLSRSVGVVNELRWHLLPLPLDRPDGLRVGVLGAGASGLAVARLLLRHGARVRLSDAAQVAVPQDLAHCPWERGRHSLDFLEGTDLVVRSPGVPTDLAVVGALREKGIPVISETEVAYELGGRPALIAVTGSAGKLATVRAMGELMEACGRPIAVGGNKGRPLSELVTQRPGQWMAVALSSFQLESIVHLRPRIAVILNIGELHLDRHRDAAETVRIKSRIFMNQGAGDVLILNRDDPLLEPLAHRHWGETLFVSSRGSVERGAWIEKGRVRLAMESGAYDAGPAPAGHPENLLSAILGAALMGAPPGQILQARGAVLG